LNGPLYHFAPSIWRSKINLKIFHWIPMYISKIFRGMFLELCIIYIVCSWCRLHV
jgi:hypothetical protein